MQFVNEIMRWKLGRLSNSDLPGIATEAIASGAESPSLCVMATLNIQKATPTADVVELVSAAFAELGMVEPSERRSLAWLTRCDVLPQIGLDQTIAWECQDVDQLGNAEFVQLLARYLAYGALSGTVPAEDCPPQLWQHYEELSSQERAQVPELAGFAYSDCNDGESDEERRAHILDCARAVLGGSGM